MPFRHDTASLDLSACKCLVIYNTPYALQTRQAMPNMSRALDTMLDTLLSDMVLGQPIKRVQRGGLDLIATKMTGRSLANFTLEAGTMRLKMDTVRENGVDTDQDLPVDVKVRYGWVDGWMLLRVKLP